MATSDPSTFQESAADVLAIIVLFLAPAIVIVVFWLVHIIPEKVAEKRQHPQKEAIKVLCLLSLVFGGLLWPIAWLWAYSKPVLHKMAYGRDKHEDHYVEIGQIEPDAPPDALAVRAEIEALRRQVQALDARGASPAELAALSHRLDAVQRAVEERSAVEDRSMREARP